MCSLSRVSTSRRRAALRRLLQGARLLAGAVLAWACLAAPAQAHKASDSYLHLSVSGREIAVRWDIALRDLDAVLALDADGDGQLSWGEVRGRQGDILRYALSGLQLRSRGESCVASATGAPLLIDDHSDGAYAVLSLAGHCARPIESLEVDYRLFAQVDAGHRGLLNLSLAGQTYSAVLGAGEASAHFDGRTGGRWRALAGYLRTGVEHIGTGFDHLLFLFSLLLPAVLYRRAQGWEPQQRLQPAALEVCRVVTAFTVAHSLTLALASFDIVRLPARVSESAIALSVVVAALNNMVPLVRRRRWIVAFCFGLIHGFGFANVLSDLGLPRPELALALVGFNLGVELGQLAIVALFLPLAYVLRSTLFYRRLLLAGGSAMIALIGALWLIERAFDLRFLPVH